MKINLQTRRIRDHKPHRTPVKGLGEASLRESRNDRGLLIQPVHEIQIAMMTSLLTDEGVDAPATADPDVDTDLPQHSEDGQHVFGSHHRADVTGDRPERRLN